VLVAFCLAPALAQEDHFTGVREAEKAAQRQEGLASREQPAALADGVSLGWDEIRPMLAEAAGAQVVQEAVLDKLLVGECRAKGVTITEADIESERRLLCDAIVREAKATPNDAERLLENVRRSRGLGDIRFRHLLERNAKMRKLVSPTVEVFPGDVSQAFEIVHGTKYACRVLLMSSETDAALAGRDLQSSPDHLAERFAERAMKDSTDPSASRGGLLDPFSAADPAYPASVRNALATMKPGELTTVLAVDRGYALVLLESIIPPDGATLASESASIEAQVRSRRERQAMDALGQRLVRDSHLRLLDRSLQWSLDAAKAGIRP
jgi:hypothetical protein